MVCSRILSNYCGYCFLKSSFVKWMSISGCRIHLVKNLFFRTSLKLKLFAIGEKFSGKSDKLISLVACLFLWQYLPTVVDWRLPLYYGWLAKQEEERLMHHRNECIDFLRFMFTQISFHNNSQISYLHRSRISPLMSRHCQQHYFEIGNTFCVNLNWD